MKHLPVPPLRQSLDRFLEAVQPLSNAEQQRHAEEVVAQFSAADGHACQAELFRFANHENEAGRSWLSRAWLSAYLTSRDPLPLVSSVGFRMRWDGGNTGIARAADVLHRVGSVHLAYLRGEIDNEVSARGDAMDMSQWQVLAGGLRHPLPGEDVILEGRPEAASREIGVLWQGRLVMMPISDGAGRPVPRSALEEALHRLPELELSDDDFFTHPSYLGSARASILLDVLLADPDNAAVYERLVHAVFIVNLTDIPASDEEHQERTTFHPGQAWAYKPFTYQVSLVDDFVGVHAEHSSVDGVTLRSMIALMQKAEPVDGDAEPLSLEHLTWRMPEDLRKQLLDDIASYRQQAAAHRVRILHIPVAVPPDLPFRVSHDALQQFVLLYAQLVAYGRARSTYEAADMREYQSGRTECLRPVTSDALALVQALIDGCAAPDHLYLALAAHRDQIITCKSGQGFNRHLFGLRLMAEHLGLEAPLFNDASYHRLTTDFLSTSSVGDAAQIMRFTFAPTSAGGIGVNYSLTDGVYEYCLIHNTDQVEHIDDFVRALEAGVSALGQLLARVGEG
ncbi:MAG: choline/carnitine O-acyltransferase [Propionibacteriaceae bacterium]|nr:choline/carnitine O-acyltransferase [Propionibacteriaceae bacterium]